MKIESRTIERLKDALIESGERRSSITSSAYKVLAREGLLSKEENAALSRVDPVAETMFLVMAADDEITESEFSALKGAIRGLTGDTLSDDVVKVMMETYARRLKEDGRAKRLSALGQAMSDHAEARNAFSLAAAVAMADGKVVDAESDLILELQEIFGLSHEQVGTTLEELKNDTRAG